MIPSSRGSIVTFQIDPPVFTFQAEQNEKNLLDVEHGPGGGLTFTDSVALIAGGGCVSVDWNRADCGAFFQGLKTANVSLGDKDDAARVITHERTYVYAGTGHDTVLADSFCCFAIVYGEEGNDSVSAAGEGGQIADGGPGDDVVTASVPCGTGGHATGLGGPGDDIVRFARCGNPQWSSTTLDGGSGADLIESRPSRDLSTADGGDGNDIIRIGTDQYEHGPFKITGGSGDDALYGGGGGDTVDGGDGDDYLDVQGGSADVVTCGAGSDIVLYDASDTVSGDCEIRSKDGHLGWFPPDPFSALLGPRRTGPAPAAPRSATRASRSG